MFRATFTDYTPCFLRIEEIKDPFGVLESIFESQPNPETTIDECWDFWTMAFRPNYWMTHDSPRVLYENFLKLARLLDTGWIISRICPSYLTIGKAVKTGYIPGQECDINVHAGGLIEAYATINNSYLQDNRFDLPFDLYNTFYQGLMPTSFDFEDLLKESAYSSFLEINKLILSFFVIYQAENGKVISKNDRDKLEEFTKFGLDYNIPQFNYYDSIDSIFESFNKSQLFSIITFLKSTSSSSFFWKNNGNPANVLYYMEELQFIMEILWSYIIDINDVNSKKWKIPKKSQSQIQYLPKHALKNPFKFLVEEFEKRDLANRRNDIEKWRLAVLDNNWHNEDEHKDIQDFLLRLIEVAELLKYRPINY